MQTVTGDLAISDFHKAAADAGVLAETVAHHVSTMKKTDLYHSANSIPAA
jgi:hypothetical protein